MFVCVFRSVFVGAALFVCLFVCIAGCMCSCVLVCCSVYSLIAVVVTTVPFCTDLTISVMLSWFSLHMSICVYTSRTVHCFVFDFALVFSFRIQTEVHFPSERVTAT